MPTPTADSPPPQGAPGLNPADRQEALGRLAASVAEGDPNHQARLTEVLTRVADFLQLNPTGGRSEGMSIDFLLDVNVPLSVELGHTTLAINDVLALEPGSVVELDREVSQPVDLTVCGTLFARGEVVVVDNRFAIRIKELINPRARKGAR